MQELRDLVESAPAGPGRAGHPDSSWGEVPGAERAVSIVLPRRIRPVLTSSPSTPRRPPFRLPRAQPNLALLLERPGRSGATLAIVQVQPRPAADGRVRNGFHLFVLLEEVIERSVAVFPGQAIREAACIRMSGTRART